MNQAARPIDGLSSTEARGRLAQFGPNVLVPEHARAGAIQTILQAATDPMAILLLIASPTYALLGDYPSAAFTAAAIVPVTAVDVFLEHRAETALQQLRRMTALTARVIRDGEERSISAELLVPGDVVLLQEGDIVPADGELIEGPHLVTNEAALTGESETVVKGAQLEADARLAFAGTPVVAGQAVTRVLATGASTRLGRIASLVATVSPPRTPLQKAVRNLVQSLAVVAAVFCLAVIVVQLLYGASAGDALLAGVSLAIAAVPEEFPLVFTLYLGLGAWRLARESALVRRLVGVETLGSTSVICADKTGTLTLGELRVTAAVPLDGSVSAANEVPLLESAVLACEVRPFDPLDIAILEFAGGEGVKVPDGSSLVADYPFDPHLKYLTHVWQTPAGFQIAAKGAIEGVLAASRAPADVSNAAHEANSRLAQQGLRVVAVAGGRLSRAPADRASDEERLEFLGLVGFVDPVRAGVMEALASCKEAGIRVVMITGDHPVTAVAVATSLGLAANSQEVCTGDELDALDDEALSEEAKHVTVFARIRPEQKLRIVRALRGNGEVVAMTGDGVNDAPALREADIGVAMGGRGTAVAREAATMVLLDDNFVTIVTAVREGRRIFANLRRAFLYLIGFHIPILLAALAIPLVHEPLFLTPVNLILLELILHPTVSFVFVNDPLDERLMHLPPRARGESLIRTRDALLPVLAGLTLTVAVIAVYLLRLNKGVPEPETRATALMTLIFGQLLLAFVLRSPDRTVLRASYRENSAVLLTTVGTIAIVLSVVLLPGASDLMKLAAPDWWWWPATAGLAAAATLWLEPLKSRLGRLGYDPPDP
jgi:Ca2+-transporting ATPase